MGGRAPFALVALVLFGACSSTPDTPADSGVPDAGPTFRAEISIEEVTFLQTNGGTVEPNNLLGTGGSIFIRFTQNLPSAERVDTGASGTCTAIRYDSSVGTPAPPALDEGTVTVAVTGGASIPPCTFTSGGYLCVGAQGSGGTGTPASFPGVWVLTDATEPSALSPADVGRYLVVAADGKAFPILGFEFSKVALFGETLSSVGPFFTVAGAGPVPLSISPSGSPGAPPNFLSDASTVQVTLAPRAGAHLSAFNSAVVDVGDAWSLDTASKALLAEGVLAHSGAVTLGCSGAGGTCGTAGGTLVAIDTTDVPATGTTDLPPPLVKSASIRCLQQGTAPVVLSAPQVQVLKNAAPKRVRISVFRVGADLNLLASRGIAVVAGQGYVKMEDVP